MSIPIFVPVTLNDGPNAGLVMAPFVDTLPVVPTTKRVLILDTPFGALEPGMYVYNDIEQMWRLELPMEAVSLIIVDSDKAFIYMNVMTPVTVPTGGVVYRNGVLTTLTTIPAGETAIFAVRVPQQGGGGGSGTVTSVNSILPDAFGNVVLTAANITGLAAVAVSGSYNDLTDKPDPYVLPAATALALGGIKVGTGLSITADGTLSASGSSYTLPVATASVLGGVTVPANSHISIDGTTGALDLSTATLTQLNNALNNVVSATGGTSLVQSVAAGTATLKALTAGTNISLSEAAGVVTINATGGGGMQTVTLQGDVTGVTDSSGVIPAVLANSGVTAGTYNRVTVDAKGRVTAGVAATTLAALGITETYLPLTGGSLSGDLTMTGGKTVKSVPDPVGQQDVANKEYVDNAVAGIANGVFWRSACDVATTANITLSGTQTIDGYAAVVGNRVLVKNQNDQTQNGVYDVAAGAWTRSSDSDTGAELLHMAVLITNGTVGALTQWANTNSAAPTVGTDAITFGQLKGAGNMYTAGAGLSLTGLQFSIANTGVAAGTYTAVTVNAQGQVTAGRAITSAEITGALGYTPYNGTTNPLQFVSGSQTITLTGDVTGNGTIGTTINSTLVNTGVTAGIYTKVTVNAKGQVTAGAQLSNAEIVAAFGYTPVNKAGDAMAGALDWAPIQTVASAATTPIGAATSNTLNISGTTTITAFDAGTSGMTRTLQFAGALTLTHSAVIKLPGAVSITTAAGDIAEFLCIGGTNWRCNFYSKADGTSVVSGGGGTPFSTTQVFNGSATQPAAKLKNAIEMGQVAATNPTTIDIANGAVILAAAAPAANWTYNFRWSSTLTLGAALAIGESVTFAVMTLQGATAFYPTAFQIDGAATAVLWQNGTAPTAGNASGRDVYTFTIVKQTASAYVVLAAQTQYK